MYRKVIFLQQNYYEVFMKKLMPVVLLCFSLLSCKTQKQLNNSIQKNDLSQNDKPKLVIGIIVDQMRYDYLTRFENKSVSYTHLTLPTKA